MRAVVFDMDGVLFDTETLCMEIWRKVAKEQNIPNMEEVSHQCIGRNANDTKILMLERYGQDFPYDVFRKTTSEEFRKRLEENGVPLKPGVKEILFYLKKEGYRVGLASSSRRETVLYYLNSAQIADFFSVIVTGDMVEHSKPEPDIYLLACEEMGVIPSEAYAIEDSPNGIRSARAAGMRPIMVPDVLAPDKEMEELSFCILDNLLEVRDFLRKQGTSSEG